MRNKKYLAYINPYLVVSKGDNYTKHIYIGSRRIAYAGSYDYYVNGQGFCCDDATGLRAGNDNPELFQYYYHSDHLGSTSLITDLDGNVVQHVEYIPFGEVFIEERNNKWNTPYLFNAKELDEETGLYYYGARYYDARVSLWLGADPMQEKYPDVSTYAYCSNNPVRFVDPDGQDWYLDTDNTRQFDPEITSQDKLQKGQTYIGKTDQVKNNKGKVVEDYRKDGSIMFTNESSGYRRIWNNTQKKGNEEMGVITDKGVLVVPDYKNGKGGVNLADYKYSTKNGNVVDAEGTVYNTIATVHTHPNGGSASATDINFAKYSTPNKPLYILSMNNTNSIFVVLSLPNSSINNGYNYTHQNLTGMFSIFTPQCIMRNKNPFSLKAYSKQQTPLIINQLKRREK